MKIPQFITKLTTKQIYGILGSITLLFGVVGFLVLQNIQNSSSKSTSNQSSSSLISISSSSSSSLSSSETTNVNLSQNSNSSQNTSTTNSTIKSAEKTRIISDPQAQKFVGKIGNSEIEMNLNFGTSKDQNGTISYDNITGSYSYKSQNKTINLKGNYSISGSGRYGGWYFEEFVESQKTGTFKTIEGSGFNSTIPEKTSKIEGTWTNAKTGEKLDFYVVREGSDAKADNYYQDQKAQPILTSECKEAMKTLNNSPNLIIIDLNFDEQIIAHRCNQGAYQSTYNFNYVNKKTNQKKLLELPNFDPETKKLSDKNNSEICLRYHQWNKQNKTLVINCSGRGLNDCGSQDTYKWLENEKKFELILVKYQGECILDKPENQNKTDQEIQKIMENLQFPIVYQK